MFKQKVGCLAMTLLIIALSSVTVVGCSSLGEWVSGECSFVSDHGWHFSCERSKEVKDATSE